MEKNDDHDAATADGAAHHGAERGADDTTRLRAGNPAPSSTVNADRNSKAPGNSRTPSASRLVAKLRTNSSHSLSSTTPNAGHAGSNAGSARDVAGHARTSGALRSGSTKNRDVSTGSLARPFAHSLAPLTRSLAPDCSLRSRPPLRSLARSLAHFAHSLARGKVNF